MELVRPRVQYRDSFIAAVKEFEETADYPQYESPDIEALERGFGVYVNKRRGMSEGKNLQPGWVPQTEYWLVDEGEYIGSVRIRHYLNDHLRMIGGHIGYNIRPSKRMKGYGKKILELALTKTKELSIDRVLVTCDVTNVGSRKIIETNGGVLENQVPNPDGGPDKLRFWIRL